MKHKKTLGILTLVSTVALAGAPWVLAQPNDPDRGGRGRAARGDRLERLDLEPAQRDQVAAILSRQRDVGRENREASREVRRELGALVRADVMDEGAIRATASRLGELEADAAIERARMHQELRQVLTSEQIETLMQRRPRPGHFGPGRGRGHGPRHGAGNSRNG